MSRTNAGYLFTDRDLSGLIYSYERQDIRNEVEGLDRNQVLASSEPDLVAYFVDKYTLHPPRLLRDKWYIEAEGEVDIDVSGRFDYGRFASNEPRHVPGQYVVVAIPFEGDPDLFMYRPSSRHLNPPEGEVVGSEIRLTLQDVRLSPDRTRAEIEKKTDEIEKHLDWIKNDCNAWNARVATVAGQCVQERKRRLLEQANMVGALGIPMKRRADAMANVPVPMTRKRRPVALPAVPTEAFKPEPTVPDAEYDYILTVIDRLSQSIERSPSTFVHMGEEQIRDMILVNLNGHYEGDATGETFNADGKTDILIRADGRNAFIAECKIWEGAKALHQAIDQILGYLTWRDTKAAVLMFSKNVDFSNVLKAIGDAIPEHPNFKQELRRISDTHVRYLFRQRDDPDRDLYLAVTAFNIPKAPKHEAAAA